MNHNRDNAHNVDLQMVPVRFEFTAPSAKLACIAGSFNNWQPEHKTLHSSGVGNWWEEMSLKPGAYEYWLVVDGKYIPDPLVKEFVSNPFGERNSVLPYSVHPKPNILPKRKACR